MTLPFQEGSPADQYYKGRGAQVNPRNKYLKDEYAQEYAEGIDEWWQADVPTQIFEEHAKKLVNKVDSPDVGMWYSMNPYQGCEHGCIYCYARNSHQYWGLSAGLDFERKIIVKHNAPELLRKFLDNKNWVPKPISLSGNTDCYQPVERKMWLTRQLLEVALEYKQPVGIITKNSLVLRDRYLLQQLAQEKLVCVYLSVTTLQEELRQKMEPRTATAAQRLKVVKELSDLGIPVGVMTAPIIPGLNDHEIPRLLEMAAANGARFAGYTVVRLNDAVKIIFNDWLYKNFPDRADKVWHHIESMHDGHVNDSEFGRRMRGSGNIADIIKQQFRLHVKKNGLNQERFEFNTTAFRRPSSQLSLF
ncbi:PA0069 family radical SAM protein [Chitinophaga nivalis]|uniref:PA0069 family radical SAM protein n=1 Tax=Chitinophaga nivalis TaxID=2991709 RepID=A0ABT3IWX1_9BACT|nr:PA0069 family radical SAM protein [Chitinophaga nivalis]MCW3462093.1 PA0069 family radical SAM protein [Chitinophaga nivalis]MCW3488215.1 PA0069 family radical SAM protein [Chitinophaga nivalis]